MTRAAAWPKGSAQDFKHVWYLAERPRASMTAFRRRRTGTLTVREGGLDFRSGSAIVRIEDIRSAEVWTPGSVTGFAAVDVVDGKISVDDIARGDDDIVNTWIVVHYGEPAQHHVAYFSDGGLLGWRSQFLAYFNYPTHEDAILAAIRALVGIGGPRT